MTLKEFINLAIQDKTNKKITFSLGKLSQAEIEKLAIETGFDLTDFERTIDNYSIKHTLKKHGNAKTESKRGQIAVEEQDFENIPEIVANADTILSNEKNDLGNTLIKYVKDLFSTNYFYVEEIRTGKKQVNLQTLYKRKVRK